MSDRKRLTLEFDAEFVEEAREAAAKAGVPVETLLASAAMESVWRQRMEEQLPELCLS